MSITQILGEKAIFKGALMKLEHESTEVLKREIMRIVGKHLDLAEYKIFFFGSRVNNRSNERSDIDIGIDGPGPVPPLVFSKIKEEIEALPVLYKIELVDFKQVSPDFRQVALECSEAL